VEPTPNSPDATGLAARIERHANALERAGRSPLAMALMRGAADDARSGGITLDVFSEGPGNDGSVPALRLLATLHRLVLDGCAPALERFYPTAGGHDPPGGAWSAAGEALSANLSRSIELTKRPVQTNEPGRSVVLYGALLQLTERFKRPIRLLEIGASAGLNLHVERFRFLIRGEALGAPDSPLEFEEPWQSMPVGDPGKAAAQLAISGRAGCDPDPIDVFTAEGRRTLLSYVWPDVRMEPRESHMSEFAVECRVWPGDHDSTIATAGNHGPPVVWGV